METSRNLEEYLKEIQKRFSKEMPRILREIKIYEDKEAAGSLSKNPISAPQFNE